MKVLARLGSVVTWVLVSVALVVALLGVLAIFPGDHQVKFLVVRTGSMEPTLPVCSVVVVKKQAAYSIGDMVTFRQGNDLVTHRIIATQGSQFQTQGDANATPDTALVDSSAVAGSVVLSVPYVGKVLTWVKTPLGFSLLIIIPSLLLVLREIQAIGHELEVIRRKKQAQMKKTLDMRVVPTQSAIKRQAQAEARAGYQKLGQSIMALCLGCFTTIGGTHAYFSDLGQSTNNTFTAGTFIAQVLVINEVMPQAICSNKTVEWIEVYNGYSTPVNLKNFKITDGSNTLIDLVSANSVIVPAGGFALLAHNASVWNSNCFDPGSAVTGNLGGNLDINIGELRLFSAADIVNPIDTVKWGSTYSLEPNIGESIERKVTGLDTAAGTLFNEVDFEVRTTPQPGL